MSFFRLMEEGEELIPDPRWAKPRRWTWHCQRCGRFPSSVRHVPARPGEADEWDYQGKCKVHGRVDVVGPEE